LVFIYIWAGPHHLHYTALPEWASTLGMLFSVMLWMPSWGGMINGLLTLRGAWNKVSTDPVLKFFVVAITFYGMSTFEGPMLSIKSINALSHYTDWTIAHVHAGALGWNGFMTFGMIYWLAPRLFQTKLWSPKLAEWHFWLGTIGILAYIMPIYVAGLTQGLMWRAINEAGALLYPDFVETTAKLIPLYWIRVGGGVLFISGAVMLFINFVMTWATRPATYQVPVYTSPRLTGTPVDAAVPESKLNVVLDSAKWIDSWSQMTWHRRWERLPLTFTIWVVLAVVAASLFEIIPTFLIRSNVPTIASVQPYTPLELLGRDLYVAEGCYNCHSQMIRPILSETKRYGDYSLPGEFVYDRPFQWGSRRIGPDLAREGGKQSNLWHLQHLENPQSLNKASLMPEYSHLLTQKLDLKTLRDRVQAAAYLGAPYSTELEVSEEGKSRAEEMAIAQAQRVAADIVTQGGPLEMEDKKVVALIAYLQRLGIDRYKPAPTPAATTPSGAPAEQPAEVAEGEELKQGEESTSKVASAGNKS
jgi:cytochrome c oxidase cbb3-type subunit I/II